MRTLAARKHVCYVTVSPETKAMCTAEVRVAVDSLSLSSNLRM
jgi:hypothetical protein